MSRCFSRRSQWFATFVLLLAMGLYGCATDRVTGLQSPHDGGRLTIPHGYVIYRTAAEYKEAFTRVNGAMLICEPMSYRGASLSRGVPTHSAPTVHVPNSVSRTAQTDDPFFRVGAIWVYNVSYNSTTSGGIDWGFLQLFFPAPGRLFGYECRSDRWLYGDQSDHLERAVVDDGYGNRVWPTPPSDPPPGVEADEYGRLTPGEQELMWWKFYNSTPTQFAAFVNTMISLRSNAIEWAAAEQPYGETDGPQDAFRHAYWMCNMARQLNEQFARDWGWAHEEGATDNLAAMMDLHNNEIGRYVGMHYTGSCADGVRQAYERGWLIIQRGFLPNRDAPNQSNPPGQRPPLDQ